MKVYAFFATLLILFSSAGLVFAQSDSATFSIRIFGGGDSNAPTIPTLLSVTPIAATQIDVTWSVATDDFTLAGYVLSRDGIPVATTTLTTYSDTGLAPSTTYAYAVQAFDAASNYSSSSNSLSTTTPDTPPPPAADPVATSTATEGTVARVVTRDVTITPGFSTTSISVTTAFPTRFEIRWGRTASYELGFVATDALRSSYYTMLTDLEPGTTYEYEIIGYTPSGVRSIIKQGQFTTLSSFDIIPPPNALRFTGIADGIDARLSWRTPIGDGIAFVRVVRSHLGFPLTPNDGAVVYQGTAESAVDVGVLSRYSPAYYTAFVYDTAGNISSGAVAVVYALKAPDRDTDSIETDTGTVPIGQPEEPRTPLPADVRMPQPFDIFVTQKATTNTFADGLIGLRGEEPTLVYIKRDAVSSYLKTIIIRLNDPTDQRITHSLLLRLNKDQTAYEAVVAPLGVAGQTVMFVDVYDLENYIVASYQTSVMFSTGEEERGSGPTFLSEITWLIAVGSGILFILIILWLMVRRATEDNNR
jgi:chitodextrinase